MAQNSILVVAAHPDDEILGCGGTMAKHAARGDQVHVLILAEGITSRAGSGKGTKKSLSNLAKAAQKANDALGVASLELAALPDNRLDSLDRLDIIQLVERKIEKLKPSIVYTHHMGDVNIDHGRAHEAVITACRPLPGYSVNTILFYETVSSTEWRPPASGAQFQPNWFEDISGCFQKKMAALKAYAEEMRPWPHPRSLQAVEHLARWRGATVGVDAAEAFMLGRKILKA